MNPTFTSFVKLFTKQHPVKVCLLFLLTFFFAVTRSQAQAPVVSTNITIPTGNANARGIAFGNGVYITILNDGRIYKSADGDNWGKVIDAGIPAGTFNGLAFGAGVFVIVGNNGLVLTSANGQNWTTRTSGATENLFDVKFLQSTFFAVGYNSTIRSSADGITWSTIETGSGTSTDMLFNITWGNGLYVISARSSNSTGVYIYRSATGASNSWTFQNIIFGTLNRVQYLKDKFYAFVAGNEVYTSTDASTWTDVTASMAVTNPDASPGIWNNSNQIFNGVYDGTRFIFYGCSQYYSGYGSVWTSTNGTDLTLLTKTAYIVPQGSDIVNGKYFQIGNEGIVSSVDGITYKYPSGSYTAVASSGTSYIGVGTVGTSGVIFKSSDFSSWSEKTPSNTKELYAVVYDGTRYVAVGNKNVMESTDDGNSWNNIAVITDCFMAIAHGNSQFVAAGYDADTYAAKIAYSPDGINWTTANSNNNYYFKVKYVNGNFFAFGYSNDTYEGVILQSEDGTSWTDITPTLSFPVYYFNDVVYDGSQYHFMGMEYEDLIGHAYKGFFSVSTATFNNPASFTSKGTIVSPPVGAVLGGDWGQGAFAYSNGHFTGSVNNVNTGETYVIYSADGISWTAVSINENTNMYGIVSSGDKFMMLGTGDGKITVDFDNLTLPVQLTSFTAALVNNQSLLKWQTATETKSHHFTVQHSSNGINWQNIGTVAAAGQSQSLRNYQFVHTNPADGYNYYRIAQVDIDNKEQLSGVRILRTSQAADIHLYPNPARESAIVELPGTKPATVSLFSAMGQLISRQATTENIVRLPLEKLPGGIYKVVVEQDGKRYSQQLYHQQ